MKVIHVLPGLNPERGGPSYSVPALCEALDAIGVDVRIHCLDWGTEVPAFSFPTTCHPMWQRIPTLGASASLRRALHAEARAVDLVHAHGLWMMPGMYAADAAHAAKQILRVSGVGEGSIA